MSIFTPHGLLRKLKRVAKQKRREDLSLSQGQALDVIASALGYNNWSLLSRDIENRDRTRLISFHDELRAHQAFASYLSLIFSSTPTEPAMPSVSAFDRAAAVKEMIEWVESNFSPLIDFAFYDSEAENGFDVRSEDLVESLQDEFSGRFPLDLIVEVGTELELDRGPWGDEDLGV